jgi:hypothetical protein
LYFGIKIITSKIVEIINPKTADNAKFFKLARSRNMNNKVKDKYPIILKNSIHLDMNVFCIASKNVLIIPKIATKMKKKE